MTLIETTPLDAALSYAHRGWRVVPIRPGEKRPPMAGWQNAATTDPALIHEWYTRWPTHGVGVATGAASGLFVLDVDVADGKRGDDTLADLEATHGALPPTAEVITGSGGRHLYFRWPEGVTITNDAGRRLGPGLDIRGEGGQVLAPPTVHPNGSSYAWELSAPEEPAEAPEWLLRMLTVGIEGERVERVAGERQSGPLPGDRLAHAVSWNDLLTAHGAQYVATRVDHRTGTPYELWARPGADHPSATLGYGGSDVLKVFSSNWPPLVEGETYTRFGFYAATRFGGTTPACLTAAASELSAKELEHGLEAWMAVVMQAAAEQPPPTDHQPTLAIRWVTDLEGGMPAEPDELIGGMLRKRELCVLGAPRALGKTWLGMNLATLLAEGEGDFLGHLPVLRPARTLYLQGELDEWGSATRWMMLTGIDRPLPAVAETFDRLKVRVVKVQRAVARAGQPTTETYYDGVLDERLEATIIDNDIDVVVVDPWAVYYGGSENSNDEAEAALATLRDLAFRHDVAIVILHHLGKNRDVAEPEDMWRGASRLADWASTRVTILPHYSESQRKERGLERKEARRFADVYFLRRSTPTDDFSMELVDGWWQAWEDPEAERGVGRPPAVSSVELVQALSEAGGEWGSVARAAEDLGVSREAAKRAIDHAAAQGLVVLADGPRQSVRVRLPRLGEAPDDLSETTCRVDLPETLSDTSDIASDQGKGTANDLSESPSVGNSFRQDEIAGQTVNRHLSETPPPYGRGPTQVAPAPSEGLLEAGKPASAAPTSPPEQPPEPVRQSWLWSDVNGDR